MLRGGKFSLIEIKSAGNSSMRLSIKMSGIYGIYREVSDKHLQRYCDEFAYRFNSRKFQSIKWLEAGKIWSQYPLTGQAYHLNLVFGDLMAHLANIEHKQTD